jgi:hypothetical protein
MLNEIIAISNPIGKLSGNGRNQALKDGPFAGLCPLTDDSELMQKDFSSILSRLAAGSVQETLEEANDANPKLAEGRLPDGMKADDGFSEKPTGKQGKDGCATKRLQTVYPETCGLVMELLSVQAPPQADLSAEPAVHASDAENKAKIASGMTTGELLEEKIMIKNLPGERNIQAGALPMCFAPADSFQDSAVQVEGSAQNPGKPPEPSPDLEPAPSEAGHARAAGAKVAREFQGRQQNDVEALPELEKIQKAGPPCTGGVQAVQIEGSAQNPGKPPEPPPDLEPAPSEAGQIQTAGVQIPQTSQRRFQTNAESTSKSEMVSKSEPSHAGRVQTVPVDGTPKLRRMHKRDSLAVPVTDTLNPVAEKNSSGAKEDQTKILSSSKSMDAAVLENAPSDQKDDLSIRHQAVKGKSASFLSAKDSVETGGITAVSAGASNTEDYETPNIFMASNQSGQIAGAEKDISIKPPEPESGNQAVNLYREGQVEKASLVNPSQHESLPEGQSFHAEVLKQVVEKTSTNIKSGQSEIRIDLKPESLGHLRLFVSSDHLRVTVKILAENIQVKEMIENQASLIKNELQQQGIHVNTVKVDMLMSGGSDFAYSQHEGSAFKQARHEPAYGGGRDDFGGSTPKEQDSLDHTSNNGGSLVNYFA